MDDFDFHRDFDQKAGGLKRVIILNSKRELE
jgi:hypothetical protein